MKNLFNIDLHYYFIFKHVIFTYMTGNIYLYDFIYQIYFVPIHEETSVDNINKQLNIITYALYLVFGNEDS